MSEAKLQSNTHICVIEWVVVSVVFVVSESIDGKEVPTSSGAYLYTLLC